MELIPLAMIFGGTSKTVSRHYEFTLRGLKNHYIAIKHQLAQ